MKSKSTVYPPDPEDISDEAVQRHECIPLASQDEVDLEGTQWQKEWQAGATPSITPWPAEFATEPLPPITVQIARQAAATFPSGTGLGWDKLHPRAIARCSDAAVLALVRILLAAELLGRWPELVGVVIACLLPKPDGGRRPIGLLPSVVRLWMRIRLDVARAWQRQHERPYSMLAA